MRLGINKKSSVIETVKENNKRNEPDKQYSENRNSFGSFPKIKTKTNKAMKTNFKKPKGQKSGLEDNVQKTIFRTAAVITTFALLSFSMSAQDSWKSSLPDVSFHEIAWVLTKHSGETTVIGKTGTYTAKFLAAEKDERLMLKDWMMKENLFGFPARTISRDEKTPFRSEKRTHNRNMVDTIRCDEEPLLLKSWMISERQWGIWK